ncbi:MAG: hypothetical protein WC934_06240 [Acidithiobacillus sp.]|uniref:hypothetical protein n=1 Tax=Acidithiobacillus sp. TaxID=1872118 RepID=UPI00355CFBFE
MMQKKVIPNMKFSCHDSYDKIIIDRNKSNSDDITDFLSKNKDDIVDITKDINKLFLKTKQGKVPQLCVRLGMYNLE